MTKSKKPAVGRRNFLKSVAAGAATLAAPAEALHAAPGAPAEPQPSAAMPVLPPLIEADPPAESEVLNVDRTGSDFMVDILKNLGFEYVCCVAGSSFRALHESVINYGGNKNPELISCCHEESSVAMGHGYAKVEGKPLCIFAHGTVGLAARLHGHLQRLLRPRPGLHDRRQHHRRHQARPRLRRVAPQRAGRRGHGPRLHQVGRLADFSPSLCRVRRARLQDCHDAADGPGSAGRR